MAFVTWDEDQRGISHANGTWLVTHHSAYHE